MDKKLLYLFSLEIRELLNKQNTSEAERKIQQSNFSQEELDFIFKCLEFDGYDPKTDRFFLFESDNSAFLKLVNVVKSKTLTKK